MLTADTTSARFPLDPQHLTLYLVHRRCSKEIQGDLLIADDSKVKSWSTDIGTEDRAKLSGLEAQEGCGPDLTKFCWPKKFRSVHEN